MSSRLMTYIISFGWKVVFSVDVGKYIASDSS